MIKCYFAHPYHSRKSPKIDKIKEELRFRQVEVYDPFLEEEEILARYDKKEYYEGKIYWQLARDIWTKDIGSLKKCQFVLGWIPDRNCIGTAAEIATAYDFKKFIQIISPLRHPMFSVYADQYFLSVDEWIRRHEYIWETYKK